MENLPNVTIREVMSTEIISVSPETGIKEVAWLMRTHGVHCILVLNAYHQVVGIISVFDFVHLVADAD